MQNFWSCALGWFKLLGALLFFSGLPGMKSLGWMSEVAYFGLSNIDKDRSQQVMKMVKIDGDVESWDDDGETGEDSKECRRLGWGWRC